METGSSLQTVKSVFGVTRVLMPVLYCGGLACYFLDFSGSAENAGAIGLGPTVLGLGAGGFLFCIPLLIKVMRLFGDPRAPGSGSNGSGRPPPPDDNDGFDADAAIARYMASKRSAEAAPASPAPRPVPKASAGPARATGFGRRTTSL